MRLFVCFDVFGDRKKAVVLKGVNDVVNIINILSLKHGVEEFAERIETQGLVIQE